MLHIYQPLSSGTGTIDQTVAAVPSGLNLTPPKETKKIEIKRTQENGFEEHTCTPGRNTCFYSCLIDQEHARQTTLKIGTRLRRKVKYKPRATRALHP
jgi:hypothetical protein